MPLASGSMDPGYLFSSSATDIFSFLYGSVTKYLSGFALTSSFETLYPADTRSTTFRVISE